MVKLAPTALTAALQETTTALSLLLEIRRQDHKTYYLTNRDKDVVFQGRTYRSDIAFTTSAISGGSAMNVDNVQLLLALDHTTFTSADFKASKFTRAEVTLRVLNFEDPSDGALIMRRGWFGAIGFNQQGFADITVVGLLKVLDFEVGRIYQPSCDTDLGSKHCRVAIDLGQAHSPRNLYGVGDWVFRHNPAEMSPFTLVNPSFEDDGARSHLQAITGWTKVMGTYGMVHVQNSAAPGSGALTAADGTYLLSGYTESASSTFREERAVYQDLNLVAGGIDAADIDAGKISFLYTVALAQTTYLLDPVRLRLEVMDANGAVLDAADTDYIKFDTVDTWRDRSLGLALVTGARTIRIYIYFFRLDGNLANGAADDVRCYWWDHTAGNPYDSVVHRVARIYDGTDENYYKYFKNAGFETDGVFPNSNTTPIDGWTRAGAGDYWAGSNAGAPSGSAYLLGGNNGSGVQSTYTVWQTSDLAVDWGINVAAIDEDRYIARFDIEVRWLDTTSRAYVHAQFLDETSTLISSIDIVGTALAYEANAAAPVTASRVATTSIPPLTRFVRIYLNARSPSGSSNAQVGFDEVRVAIVNAEEPARSDPLTAEGEAGTVFNTGSGTFTVDGNLIWKAHPVSLLYDTVASVSSTKQFAATLMDSVDGYYTGAAIRWISGANKGNKNVVRTWTETGKIAKLYFPEPNAIQVGDRFQYVLPCNKRFLEDCVLQFANAINFRGFPHIPGRLDAAVGET